MTLNDKIYTKNYLEHNDLTGGAVLDIRMSDKPNYQRGTNRTEYPYSFSQEE